LGFFIESFDDSAPRLVLGVIDLAQIQHLALHHLAPSAALTLHDVPVTMLLAVFDSPIAAQIHLGVRLYSKSCA
jgi:hypothetical protein